MRCHSRGVEQVSKKTGAVRQASGAAADGHLARIGVEHVAKTRVALAHFRRPWRGGRQKQSARQPDPLARPRGICSPSMSARRGVRGQASFMEIDELPTLGGGALAAAFAPGADKRDIDGFKQRVAVEALAELADDPAPFVEIFRRIVVWYWNALAALRLPAAGCILLLIPGGQLRLIDPAKGHQAHGQGLAAFFTDLQRLFRSSRSHSGLPRVRGRSKTSGNRQRWWAGSHR